MVWENHVFVILSRILWGSKLVGGFTFQLTAVLADTAAEKQSAFIKFLDSGNKTRIKFIAGVFFCSVMLYHKISHSFRCDFDFR